MAGPIARPISLPLHASIRARLTAFCTSSILLPYALDLSGEDSVLGSSEIRTKQFERILLIKPSALGDVIHAVPVLVKLRARFPSAQIDWLLTPDNAELVRHHPALSRVVSFDRRAYGRFGRSWSATAGLFRSVHELWKNRYDLVIDLHGQLRSALLTLATAAPVRVGFDRPLSRARRAEFQQDLGGQLRGWAGAREGAWVAYSHRIPIPTLDVHAVDRYLWLAAILGLDDEPPDLRIFLPPEADKAAESLLKESGVNHERFALLAPGTTWQTKHWQIEGFADVARQFLEKGLDVVLAGAPRDRARCHAIKELCPQTADLSGRTTTAQLAAIIRRSTICVSNDSGAMHLAVALVKPVVSVFGPTSPVRVGPYGRPEAVIRAALHCSPCHLRKLRECPHDHSCMKQVTSQMVIERVQGLLDLESDRTQNRLAG
jgi:lipopolysaccharide heptosyltransferase I